MLWVIFICLIRMLLNLLWFLFTTLHSCIQLGSPPYLHPSNLVFHLPSSINSSGSATLSPSIHPTGSIISLHPSKWIPTTPSIQLSQLCSLHPTVSAIVPASNWVSYLLSIQLGHPPGLPPSNWIGYLYPSNWVSDPPSLHEAAILHPPCIHSTPP
jgi:hypothetical protein